MTKIRFETFDLRRCQAHAGRRVHRFEHVVDELLEKRFANLFGIDPLGHPAKCRVASVKISRI